MVRSTQLLHTQREPAPIQPAATVLLLRDTPAGFEVLMTRRSATARFVPGAYVFPGGAIDAADAGKTATNKPGQQSGMLQRQAMGAHQKTGVPHANGVRTQGAQTARQDQAAVGGNGP